MSGCAIGPNITICSFSGGTGCPGDAEKGQHYYAYIDPSVEGRICIDCGEPEGGQQ